MDTERLLLSKIENIVDEITANESECFQEIDKHKLLENIASMLNNSNIDADIPDEEPSERIKRILILETLSGILKELTPEQEKNFNEITSKIVV